MLLEVDRVARHFGGLIALHDVSLTAEEGKITGLIGPNGSGKTTLVNIISGFLRPTSGRITFDGQSIEGSPPYKIARMGLCRTFQITLNPQRMTVMENMLLGARQQLGEQVIMAALHPWAVRREEQRNLERAWHLLELVKLQNHANELAGGLSGGQKKLLALVQVLMARPRLILLDEPVAGVNPRLIDDIVEVIKQLQKDGETFLIIEHNMAVIRELCDTICVLDMGRVLAEGPVEAVLAREDVLRAYIAAGGEVGTPAEIATQG
ncbi:MAG TPA: ABC transporter ATP-binding protein [Castellaniella sp.]|uniref:ABC transporter ATP-binding protein n=1 Tax=Castellaniella sp. TaxID=1955812 RepID=UPI002F157C3C